MKVFKIVVALFSATLLFTPMKVQGNENNVYETWKQETIISPDKGKVVAAGEIVITFSPLIDDTIIIDYYDVYLDGVYNNTIEASKDIELTSTVYTTEVQAHTIQVVAISDEYKLHSNIRTFGVSKKGIGVDKNKQMQDMHLSWYYNWDKKPSNTITNLEYVPMIWSNYEGSIEWLQTKSKNYHTVLGFNEPDLVDQANIEPHIASIYQEHFTASNLRIGAPVVSYDPSNNAWFDTYVRTTDMDDIDFIPMHVYYDWGGEGMVDAFFKAIDDTYEKYQKPIWISEYGLTNIWLYGQENTSNLEQIKQYMKDTIKGLEEREYVERYAWFSYGMMI
ncbi:MAG: glycosyl hydrolase [Coprobacillaceae bacterium]